MSKTDKYSPEVGERAVRLVEEARKDYPSPPWSAIESIAPKIGCAAVTLHEWVKKHEVDTGVRDGVPTAERERLRPWSARSRSCARPMSRPCKMFSNPETRPLGREAHPVAPRPLTSLPTASATASARKPPSVPGAPSPATPSAGDSRRRTAPCAGCRRVGRVAQQRSIR